MTRVERFVPARLTEAREARGLTGVALADMVGLTPVTISAYEHGRFSPKAESLQGIARTLNFPVAFFTLPHLLQAGERRPVFWRKLGAATKTSRMKCQHRLSWLLSISDYLSHFLELPEVTLPTLKLPAPDLRLTDEHIETLAQDARSAFGLGNGPIHDVLLLLENSGVVVSRFNFESDGLDAFSHWGQDGRPYIAIGTEKRSLARLNANALHELAHLILHSGVTWTEFRLSKNHKILEQQARHFASAFALPTEAFTSELWAPTLNAFEALKLRWHVSMGMMIGRCGELGILSDDQIRWMWIQYSRRGYRKKEPLDDQMPEVTPRLLRRSIEMLVNDGLRSRDDIRADLALPDAVIEELCSVKPGYLTDTVAPTVHELPKVRRPRNSGDVSRADTMHPVVPFIRRG